jgi:two-component system OmpR family response regulator
MTFDPGTNVVDAHISNLRQKLEEGGGSRLIHTVRGVGYVLRAGES